MDKGAGGVVLGDRRLEDVATREFPPTGGRGASQPRPLGVIGT